MARTIVEVARAVTGGVDTHLDVHVAAALDPVGGLLGVESFPTTAAGYRSLVDWMSGFGPLQRVGVEGTGAYGAGLARYLARCGVEVIEVDRANRQARRAHGKSDSASRTSGRASRRAAVAGHGGFGLLLELTGASLWRSRRAGRRCSHHPHGPTASLGRRSIRRGVSSPWSSAW